MRSTWKRWLWVMVTGLLLGGLVDLLIRRPVDMHPITAFTRIEEVRHRVGPRLRKELEAEGFGWGEPLYIRIFKETRELEVWLRPERSRAFRLFRTYPAYFSGELGPKLAEGDGQAPEGFYEVGPNALNPESDFHLSFNIGFPNAFDRAAGRTGSWIMVHGGEASIGCFAMTDPGIEEIYLLAEAALQGSQGTFPVHVFPFRMSRERVAGELGSDWHTYWENLLEGYDQFEATHIPPEVSTRRGRYVFGDLKYQ